MEPVRVSALRAGAESAMRAVVSMVAMRLVSGRLVLVDSAFVSSALATVSGAEELPLSAAVAVSRAPSGA